MKSIRLFLIGILSTIVHCAIANSCPPTTQIPDTTNNSWQPKAITVYLTHVRILCENDKKTILNGLIKTPNLCKVECMYGVDSKNDNKVVIEMDNKTLKNKMNPENEQNWYKFHDKDTDGYLCRKFSELVSGDDASQNEGVANGNAANCSWTVDN